MEQDIHFANGKDKGLKDRLTAVLCEQELLSGQELLRQANMEAMTYTKKLHREGWLNYYDMERDQFVLGYLIGYLHVQVTVQTSSLTLVEAQDVSSVLLLQDYTDL